MYLIKYWMTPEKIELAILEYLGPLAGRSQRHNAPLSTSEREVQKLP
jgi:hypothetical protein